VATYFESTSTAHLSLIPSALRAHNDLSAFAVQAEADVIEHYTTRVPGTQDYTTYFYTSGRGYNLGNGYFVVLEGYDPDADLCTDDALKRALRYTITDVLVWRLQKLGEGGAFLSSVATKSGGAKAFRDDFKRGFPPDWNFRLSRWELGQPQYHI
jgi:hypothetical protein